MVAFFDTLLTTSYQFIILYLSPKSLTIFKWEWYNYRKRRKVALCFIITMNITLIGMAGVGKSAIGKILAKQFNYKFIDTDKVIEEIMGLRLQQIIDKLGESAFLEVEEKAILRLKFKLNGRCVIATGGSAVYSKKAMKFLKENSKIIFLNTSFKNINHWLINKNTRGIIHLEKEGLRDIFKERLPLYKIHADMTINL